MNNIVNYFYMCIALYGSLYAMHEQASKRMSCLMAKYHTLSARTAVTIALGLQEHKRDASTMMTLFEYGASCNNTQALYELGRIYQEGIVQPKDLEKARVYFYQAALFGYAPACFELGCLLIDQFEYTQGLFWIFKAAHGHVSSSRVLWYVPALSYLEEVYAGVHGTQLYEAFIDLQYCGDYFFQLFSQACVFYHEKSDQQAFKYFTFLATYKHPLALYMLGVCYDTGRGVERDTQKAYCYYKQAALCGYSVAQQACTLREHRGQAQSSVHAGDTRDTSQDSYLEDMCNLYKNLDHSMATIVKKTLDDFVRNSPLEDHQRFACVVERNGLQQFLEQYAQTIASAAYLCGLVYRNKDTQKADKYLTLAAENNSVQASFTLARQSRAEDSIHAALYYYYLCALEHKNALHEEQKLIQESLDFLQERAEKKDHYAQICLALWYLLHHNKVLNVQGFILCEKILSEAVVDTTLASCVRMSTLVPTLHNCLARNARVGFLLAVLYLTVPGFIDEALGMHYLQEAAQKGVAEAQLMLSYCYAQGKHGEQDNKQAFSWLVAAHNQGLRQATFELALVYQNGSLVAQDLEKALELLHSPVLDTYEPAVCLRIIHTFMEPSLTKETRKKLIDQLEYYAQKGDKNACLSLGIFYYFNKDDWGKDKLDRAYAYFETAAAQGESSAYRFMGRMHYFAQGVNGDKKQGQELLEKALALGDQEALVDLGDIFCDQREYDKAFDCYKNCYVKSKSADAAACLARCYLKGHGVEHNIRQAVNYAIIALKLGTAVTDDFILTSPSLKAVLVPMILTIQALACKGNAPAYTMFEVLKRAVHDAGYTLSEHKHAITIVRRV